MQRPTPAECEPGDWIPMMEAPAEWEAADSPVSWQHPDGSIRYFAFTEVPVRTESGDVAGTEFVWMLFKVGEQPPPPPSGPTGFRTREPKDPADWWKSE